MHFEILLLLLCSIAIVCDLYNFRDKASLESLKCIVLFDFR